MRYLDALAFVQLLGEFAPSTASAASLRTDNRREPQDSSGQLILVMVGLDQKLLHPFGGGVDVLWPAGMIFVHRHIVGRIELRARIPFVGGDATGEHESADLHFPRALQHVQTAVDVHPYHLLGIARITW